MLPLTVLSERQTEVAKLVVAGYRAKAIAKQLTVTTHTVKTHIHEVYIKLGIPDDPDIDPKLILAKKFWES